MKIPLGRGDAARRGDGLSQRIVTVGFGIPILLAMAYFGGWGIFFLTLALAMLGLKEFFTLMAHLGHRPVPPLGYLAGVAMVVAAYHQWPGDPLLLPSLLVIAGGMVAALGYPGINWTDVAITVTGVFYVAGLFSYLVLLSALEGGRYFVLLTFLLTWTADTAAYLVGKRWGRRKLFPRLSPGKTRAGCVAALVGGAALGVILSMLSGANILLGAAFGLGAGVVSQAGDLAESALKRSAGVKDAGTMLPGHGGILDRFDSMLLVAPYVFYLGPLWLKTLR